MIPFLVFVAFARNALAACPRDQISVAATSYIKALQHGRPDFLNASKNLTYIENEIATDVPKGILSQNVTVDISRSLFDSTTCTAFIETTAATNVHPYVISARLLISEEKITSLQLVIADSGDWLFNATSHLRWTKQENWDEIPKGKKDTREVIQAAADAYLDSWPTVASKSRTALLAHVSKAAHTLETRTHPQTHATCPNFPKPFAGALNRRYVIDEEMGGVGIFNNFPFIDATRPNGRLVPILLGLSRERFGISTRRQFVRREIVGGEKHAMQSRWFM